MTSVLAGNGEQWDSRPYVHVLWSVRIWPGSQQVSVVEEILDHHATDPVYLCPDPRHQWHQNRLRVPPLDALRPHHLHDLFHHTLRKLLHEGLPCKGKQMHGGKIRPMPGRRRNHSEEKTEK
ncbi:hypothetical protein evm_010099 [Chilo suppressalis]|nr:hypothetical protein evm_010099 [Chilo suppressalis]